MQTAEIRRRFLSHFEQRDHEVVPSASLLFDDPTLLFVNAGMVPFVPYFTGQQTPPWKRAVSVQKCLRTLDIEEVGKTSRHGTFFQMCGNFSFGDYFKREAITTAWALVTTPADAGGLGLDPARIWPTTYHDDHEATALWREISGLPADRIQHRGMVDNYWSMGIAGPCGPCSEIFYDRGPQYGPDGGPIVDEDRFIEIWNLVFMQNERGPGGAKEDYPILGELPRKNIDTGMGLERVASVLQGKNNLYEIDEIFPVVERAEQMSGRNYGADHTDDVRFRIVADHVRSALMLIGDGVRPGNEGRGYVLRRLIRRAVHSMRLLGVEEPALPHLLPVSEQLMSRSYPELAQDSDRIAQVAYAEEEAFGQTLRAGTQIFDTAVGRARARGDRRLSGAETFQLHDTYGFPVDLTLEMADEQGLEVDEAGFRALMQQQRERAKADSRAKKGQHADTAAYRETVDRHGSTESLAFETLSSTAEVRSLLGSDGAGAPGQLWAVPHAAAGELVEVVLDRTPFYAESGGQAADTGELAWAGGRGEVVDVQRPVADLVVHRVRVLDGTLETGVELRASIDEQWRLGACQAHSGTHIVHAALREILGPTALQSGSYNRPGYLRLDFGWNAQVGASQVAELEQASNEALRADLEVSAEVMPLAEARAAGALALFGQRYPDLVRMVQIGGPWSRELCGGTHVERSSQIGTVVLLPIASVGAGNRRVEAYVGLDGLRHLTRERDLVDRLTDLLKTPHDDLVGRVEDMVERLRTAERKLEAVRVQQLLSSAGELADAAHAVDDVQVVTARAPEGAGAAQLRTLALDVRGRLPADRPGVVAVVGSTAGKPAVVVTVNDTARDHGLSASALVKVAAGVLGGSGGGRDDVAQGGGAPSPGDGADARLVEALAEVERAVEDSRLRSAGGV